ncbi:DUF6193 family natural product biosynthesis protein [Kitasatospora sp. NPDC088346]|uniref:DUF6193 family natural product biosynthesis protein n=1 Tax=Kitasatospora sp. NPDC088346 TaxID=3364073 RepID=UPI003811CE57
MSSSEGPGTGADPVAEAWEEVRRQAEIGEVDKELVEAAHADPVIGVLFPMVGHGSLQLSRCTKFPWSKDLPSVFPTLDGGFRIHRLYMRDKSWVADVSTPQEAVRFVRDNIPEGCGPAIDGTPDQIAPL